MTHSEEYLRIPPWLRVKLPKGKTFCGTRGLLDDLNLNTVCQSARCPNMFECFSRSVATFLIMGRNCTRNCRFCNISPGPLEPLDPDEPRRVAEAVRRLELAHAVITSVTRDDLPDGGAAHFAATLRAIRDVNPDITTEVLIPDFQGDADALKVVVNAQPDILNHNVETAPRLYADIRPRADFTQSLELLARAAELNPDMPVKSGLMVGLGETDDEVREVVCNLRDHGCTIVTIGQYMRPSMEHPAVKRYVHPDVFAEYGKYGESIGIPHVFSEPLVRSSYNASKFIGGKGKAE